MSGHIILYCILSCDDRFQCLHIALPQPDHNSQFYLDRIYSSYRLIDYCYYEVTIVNSKKLYGHILTVSSTSVGSRQLSNGRWWRQPGYQDLGITGILKIISKPEGDPLELQVVFNLCKVVSLREATHSGLQWRPVSFQWRRGWKCRCWFRPGIPCEGPGAALYAGGREDCQIPDSRKKKKR